jgi:hypothetical protein
MFGQQSFYEPSLEESNRMAKLHDPNEWASSFSAIGFSRFYKNRTLRWKRFSQPVLMGQEGKKQGVYGFGVDLYCPCCDEMSDFVLVEFESSGPGSSLAWGEINFEEFGVDLMKCPRCGNRELIFQLR